MRNPSQRIKLRDDQVVYHALWSIHVGKYQVYVTIWLDADQLPPEYDVMPYMASKYHDDPEALKKQKCVVLRADLKAGGTVRCTFFPATLELLLPSRQEVHCG